MKCQITFLVFTFNEERRLEYYLKCIQGWGRIVVIDNHSTDRTREIASLYTEHIYLFENPGYIENEDTMHFALSKVTTKWAYLGYVDELLPRPLLRLLGQIATENRYEIVEIYRRNFMYGQEIFNYGKHHLRMFVPGAIDFAGNIIHKMGNYLVPKDKVFNVPNTRATALWHFSSYNTDKLELAHNRYANLEAKQRQELLHQRFSGIRAIWNLCFYFWGTYLGLGGFRGGWPGFFVSVQIAYFQFSIEARLWEGDNGLSLEQMELRYNEIKVKLLKAESSTEC